jgi:predicted aspartyl protease
MHTVPVTVREAAVQAIWIWLAQVLLAFGGAATARADPSPEAFVLDVPFHFATADQAIPMVEVEVNGERFDFLLDTGNGESTPLVSPSLVERLGLVTQAGRDAQSLARVRLESLALGSHRIGPLDAAILPAIDTIAERIGIQAGGNLGYGFFKEWRVCIDYGRRRLQLQPSRADDSRLASAALGTPFELGTLRPYIHLDVRVNGERAYRFLLDTGSSASVISPAVAAAMQVAGTEGEALGVAGSQDAKVGTLSSLEAAGETVANPTVVVIDIFATLSTAVGMPIDGILGYSFLSHFRVEIDYPTQRLTLVRNEPRGRMRQ